MKIAIYYCEDCSYTTKSASDMAAHAVMNNHSYHVEFKED